MFYGTDDKSESPVPLYFKIIPRLILIPRYSPTFQVRVKGQTLCAPICVAELLSVLLLGLLTASVSALPCCPADNEVTYANESLVCHTGELISLQRWCDTYFMITKDDPEGSEFKENDNRTEFYIGSEWTEQ